MKQPWGFTYQFDGHVFISIEIFSQPQLAKVPTANFFAHTEVWTNHKNSRIGPRTPTPMSSPAACCLRHLFPFLCLSLAPSLVKIHKLVIPWPLHGYSPAMQTIEIPITMTEKASERGRKINQDRGKVFAAKMCNGSQDHWENKLKLQLECVAQDGSFAEGSLLSSCSSFTGGAPFLCLSPAPVSE